MIDAHERPVPSSPRLRGAHAALAAAALVLATIAGAAHAQETRGIAVTATGVAYGPPDLAYLDVGFTTTDANVAAALAAADEAIVAVRAALEALGVDDRDVRTTTFTVWREERYEERTTTPTIVYRVTHHLRVTVRAVDAVGRLLVAATEAGANYVGGVTFTVQDPRELAARARTSAFETARAKAEQLARLAGVELGAPLSIAEIDLGGPVVPFATARALPAALEADAAVATGDLAIEVRLEVRFALE